MHRFQWIVLAASTLTSIVVAQPAVTPPDGSRTVAHGDLAAPAVAYDADHDVYLSVWYHTAQTPGQNQLRARFLDREGTPVGRDFTLRAGLWGADRIDIANVNEHDMFVVTYLEDASAYALTVHAGTGAVVGPFDIADGLFTLGTDRLCSVGGDDAPTGNRVAFAWLSIELEAHVGVRRGTVLANGKLVLEPKQSERLASVGSANPRLSRTPGPDGRHLLVWEFGSYSGWPSVNACLVDDSSCSATLYLGVFRRHSHEPEVATDGEEWVVTYTTQVHGQFDLCCQKLKLEPGVNTLVAEAPIRLTDTTANEQQPTVALAGDSFVVAFEEKTGQATNLLTMTLDPFTCGECTPAQPLDVSPMAASSNATAAAGPSGEALVLWTRTTPTTTEIRAQRVLPSDGIVSDLAGGCAGGGTAHATCAVGGNLGFTHRVRNAAPGASAFLLLGTSRLDLPCGPCAVVPNPMVAIAAGATNAQGHAQVSTPLAASPSVVGAALIEQWLVLPGQTTCPTFQSSLSNAISVQIQ